jgi:hypothetical protein
MANEDSSGDLLARNLFNLVASELGEQIRLACQENDEALIGNVGIQLSGFLDCGDEFFEAKSAVMSALFAVGYGHDPSQVSENARGHIPLAIAYETGLEQGYKWGNESTKEDIMQDLKSFIEKQPVGSDCSLLIEFAGWFRNQYKIPE